MDSPTLHDHADVPSAVLSDTKEHADSPRGREGGLRPWLAIMGGWMTLFCVLGQTNSFGVFQELYTRSHTASASKNSWIGSFQLFLTVATGLPAGKLLDMGYFKPVFLAGSVLYVFSCFMLSLVHLDRYYQIFLCQSIGMGIGGGLLYLPAVAIQAHHWKDHKAFAIGVVFSGASAGGIAFPIMLNRLFHGSVGFAWGVRAIAFLILGLLSIANLVMSPGDGAPNKASPTTPPHQGMEGILRDIPYVLVVLGVFCINWGLFFPIFYLQLYATVHGVVSSVAFYTQAMSNASSIVGRTVCGFLADAVGPFNVFTPSVSESRCSCSACLELRLPPPSSISPFCMVSVRVHTWRCSHRSWPR